MGIRFTRPACLGISLLLVLPITSMAPARANERTPDVKEAGLLDNSGVIDAVGVPVDSMDHESIDAVIVDALPEPCVVSDRPAGTPSSTPSRAPSPSTSPTLSITPETTTAEPIEKFLDLRSGTHPYHPRLLERDVRADVTDVTSSPQPKKSPSSDTVDTGADAGDGEELRSNPGPVESTASGLPRCPVAPVGLAANPNVNAVLLQWSPGPVPKDDPRFVEPSAYYVEVSGSDRRVLRTTQTRMKITGLRNGTTYRFAVYSATPSGRSDSAGLVESSPTTGTEGVVAGLIVRFHNRALLPEDDGELPGADRITEVDLSLGEQVTDDAVVVELSESVDLATAERLAAELAEDEDVSWAEPDQFFFTSSNRDLAQAVGIPIDANYATDQWNLWDEFGVSIGDSPNAMTDAWAGVRGDGVTVAVIDTGITPHPDLDSQIVHGYDFVSNPDQLAAPRDGDGAAVAFDGDYVDVGRFGSLGRDGDPTDPGDWRGVAPARDSSWHGTKIAGLIAAAANDSGLIGVAPNAKVQPIRALSWRGGLLSDIAASITWASGGAVDGAPRNATPSKVINMSFAVETVCPTTLQKAIDGAIERGSILVAAAGNASDDATKFAPGNCNGVVTVAATDRDGNRARYSNHGKAVDVSAPGGDATNPVTVASNIGSRASGVPGIGADFGTSIAAAHVSAAAALLASRNPALSPTDAFEELTGRTFTKAFANRTCDPGSPDLTCGSGIVSLGLAQVASTNCTRTEANLVGNGAGGTVNGRAYVLVTFTTVGSCSWTPPRGVTSIDYLVVGGGGGGGSARSYYAAGGGGGGEVLAGSNLTVSSSNALAIQVGAGGARSTNGSAAGGTGGASRLADVTARGGGGGASGAVSPRTYATAGYTGGGGGGFSRSYNHGGAGASPLKGGGGVISSVSSRVSGGGGAGAGGNGVNGSTTAGGAGGPGVASAITGTSVRYGGGGGGGKRYAGSAGAGVDGGGSGAVGVAASNGVNGRGGGGGGAGSNSTTARAGGFGGSGVVIVRFETPPPDDVRLTYDANGGSSAPSEQRETADTQATVAGSAPVRTGYVFVSWNTAVDGSGTTYAPNSRFTMPWSDLTLYAQWAALGFLVEYDANEGSGAPDEQIAANGEIITLAVQGSMTRAGYDFTGWNTQADGSGTSYSAGQSLTVTSSLTLFAQWRIRTITLSYDANGGSSPPVSQSADFNTAIALQTAEPSRLGYTFTGWNTVAAGTGDAYQPGGSFTMPADDLSLFAQWVPASRVLNYSANGGTGAPISQISYAFAAVELPSQEPTRSGYRFASWNSAIDGSGSSYSPGGTVTMPAGDLTLYAQWTANSYSTSYDANGGSGAPGVSTNLYGSILTISPAEPTRAGYRFNGWNTAANGSGVTWNPGNTLTVTEDIALFAQWLANIYTLRYNSNGGSGPPEPAAVSTNASITVSSTQPSRVGYTFAGWNTRRDGSGVAYASGAALVMPGSDVTLFAQWSDRSYSVSYHANNGTGSPPSTNSRSFLAATTVASSSLSRSGFTFIGWNSAADGSGSSYSPGSTFLMPATNIILYAQWIANNYALIYDGNGGSGAPAAASASSGESVRLSNVAPTREGYTFSGWLASDGVTLQGGDPFTMPGATAVLKATWSIRSFTVRYSGNGGEGTPDGSTETFGDSVLVSPTEPTRTGHIFTGWNSRANGTGTDFASNARFSMPAEDLTLFAQWRKVTPVPSGIPSSAGPSSPESGQPPSSTSVSVGLTCRATVCAVIRKPLPVPTLPSQARVPGVVVDGQKQVALTVKPIGDQSAFEVRGVDFGVILKSAPPTGASPVAPVDQGLVIPEGGRLEAAGDGFLADSIVRGFIMEQPMGTTVRAPRSVTTAVDLGEVSVDSDGAFETSWEIPWGLASGDYVLQLNGLNPQGEVRSLNVDVVVKRSPADAALVAVNRAGFFASSSGNVTPAGLRKVRRIVASLPSAAEVVQVVVTGVSMGRRSPSENAALAERRATSLAKALASAGVDIGTIPVVYRTFTSPKAAASYEGIEGQSKTSKGKLLSSITLIYESG